MTEGDLLRIEQALGIVLPESYRLRIVPFPVPAASGNSDLGVWDDAGRLIEFNLELRRGAPGGGKPWPSHFFAIGHPGDGCPHALNLSVGDAVWWVDHCHLANPSSQQESASFGAWADDYFATLREEMAGEEVDPDGTPAQRATAEAKEARASAMGCLSVAAVIGVAVVLLMWLSRR